MAALDAPAPAPTADTSSIAPPLRVDPETHDLGEPVQHDEVRRSFSLSNQGTTPVSLQSVDRGHSCSVTPTSGTIAPGQRLPLELTCRPRMHGAFLDQLRLRTDARTQGELRIVASGQVTPAAVFEQDILDLHLPYGERHVEEVRTEGARSGALALRLRPADQARWRADGLSVGVLPATDDRSAGIRVEFEARRVGRHAGTLLVETGFDGEPQELLLPYALHVSGTLSVAPEPLYVNLRVPSEGGSALEIRSTQPDFRVDAVRVLAGPFEVTEERVGPGHHRATVHVAVDRLDRDVRGVVGHIEIQSNDRTEPRKDVPLFAFGKAPELPSAERSSHTSR